MAAPARRIWTGLGSLVFAAMTVGCAAHLYVPPSGVGEPFPESALVWDTLTARCRDAGVFVAEIRMDGWAGTRRQPLSATLHGALTRGDDIYLEVPAPGRSFVQMAGRAGDVLFLLPRDERVLRAPSRDVVEALTGLRWGGRDLLQVLSGCIVAPVQNATGATYRDRATIELGPGARAYLRQRDREWQLVAASRDGLLIEYRAREGAFPSDIRVTAASPDVTPLQLTFLVKQLQVNIDLPATTFDLAAPPNFVPMTLAELRASSPLGEGKNDE